MNDIFSFQRFALLLKKFTKEHTSMYLLYLAALSGIMILVYGLTTLSVLNTKFPQDAPIIYFDFGICLMGCLFSSSFYGFFNNKAKGIQYLNLPAAAPEKLLLGFLFTQVVFTIVYIGMFYCIDQLMVWVYNHFHHTPADVPADYNRMFHAEPLDFSNNLVRGAIMIAFVVMAMSHFGSLCFEKNAFVKTALLIIIGGAAFVFYNFYGMRSMIPEESMPGGMPFYNESLRVGTASQIRGIVYLPDGWTRFLYWFLPGMFYVLFWTASYFKLKEKQV